MKKKQEKICDSFFRQFHFFTNIQRYQTYIFIMADPRLRQIFIKAGVVKRYAKEKVSYEKEAEREQKRIEKFIAENRDEHDIKKQQEVIQESLMMVPECQRR